MQEIYKYIQECDNIMIASPLYFSELTGQWSSSDFLTVRISQIESRILSACPTMVTDIGGTKINGKEENLVLGPDSIPVRGAVSG